MFGMAIEVWVMVGLMVLVVMFLMSMFAGSTARRARTKRWWCMDSAARAL